MSTFHVDHPNPNVVFIQNIPQPKNILKLGIEVDNTRILLTGGGTVIDHKAELIQLPTVCNAFSI
jgi:hypothetical protein